MKNKDDYRSNLINKIKEEPDRIKRRGILLDAKRTDEYERADLKRRGIAFEALIQDQSAWQEFEADNIDQNNERKPATAEQIARMDQRLSELGSLFEGSNINWQLDGAVNISLMNGKYIGNHKDVDISVDINELDKLEELLSKKGYGLFLSQGEDESKEKTMRRVGYKNLQGSFSGHPLIAAIDKNGIIIEKANLNYVDLHLMKRNSDGKPVGISGAVMPEKWTEHNSIDFHGQKINLSHPGKVLYYKLHQGRNYDATDIYKFIETGRLSETDINEVEGVYENEFLATKELAHRIFKKVESEFSSGGDEERIFAVLMQQPEFKEKKEMETSFKILAREIFNSNDQSAEKMVEIAINLFGFEERSKQKIEELETIKQRVINSLKLKEIRSDLL